MMRFAGVASLLYDFAPKSARSAAILHRSRLTRPRLCCCGSGNADVNLYEKESISELLSVLHDYGLQSCVTDHRSATGY